MKRSLLILCFFAALGFSGFSQGGGLRKNLNGTNEQKAGSRIEALKIAFLTRKLNLTPEEAQRFWPIYNQYTQEVSDATEDKKQNKISELDTEEKILKIRKKYNTEITKALNAEKANTFFAAEKDFNKEVTKVIQERNEARKNRLKQ